VASPQNLVDMQQDLFRLQQFLANAPVQFGANDQVQTHTLPNQQIITCVLWRNAFFISGTDIVKIVQFRFDVAGQAIKNMKKFEEGIFSDLRNLKPGVDAVLENPRSEFLELLFKYGCIRTQKKQKVFFWFSVPHDQLFRDAVERELKRERDVMHTVPSQLNTYQSNLSLPPTLTALPMASPYTPMLTGTVSPQFMDLQSPEVATGGNPDEQPTVPIQVPMSLFNGEEGIGLGLLDNLASHMDMPYVCLHPNCGRKFKRTEHLRRHARCHAKTYTCQTEGCRKTFSRPEQLQQHQLTIHRMGSAYMTPFMTPVSAHDSPILDQFTPVMSPFMGFNDHSMMNGMPEEKNDLQKALEAAAPYQMENWMDSFSTFTF
jgi:hypothetical protein